MRQLSAVGEQKRSGLILCKSHYAEFAGPGAAVCNLFESDYATVIAIGSPELVEVNTHAERQKAYSRRIQWVRWLHKIVAQPEPMQRAEKLLVGFEEFFGSEILAGIPDVTLSLLAGVLPQTMTAARFQQSAGNHDRSNFSPKGPDLNIVTLDLKALAPAKSAIAVSLYKNFNSTPTVVSCSA